MERGIGEDQWVNDYVGIPYEAGGRNLRGIDCYGLVCKVYKDILKVSLPDWVLDDKIDWDGQRGKWTVIDRPFNFCILRSVRTGAIPDHFGLFIAGGVLSVGPAGSMFTTLDNYLSKYPGTIFGVYE